MNFFKFRTISILGLASLVGFSATAAKLEVNWVEPEKYRDIRAANENSSHFKQRVFDELSKQFEKTAEALPENQQLVVNVTNVDLAGDIDYFWGASNQTMRVIKEIYFPRINLNYQLSDSDGTVLKFGEESLKDMSFMDRSIRMRHERGGFGYEKRLIEDWSSRTFKSQ